MESDPIDDIENDGIGNNSEWCLTLIIDFYRYFLQSHSKTLSPQGLSICEQVKKLGDGIDLISRELQKQVVEKHEDLLRQGNHATKLENVLSTMSGHVENLFANAERLRNQVIFVKI